MKCKTLKEQNYSYKIKGSVGFSQYFGNAFFGQTRFGSDNSHAGVFQKRYLKSLKKEGEQVVKMRFYRPEVPNTPLRTAWLRKLGNGTIWYKNLINQGFFEGKIWPISAPKNRSHTYISLFMKEKPIFYGVNLYSECSYGKEIIL